jgi:tetraacyldisaccharide 4'-kinase
LNDSTTQKIPVIPDPSRVRGAAQVLVKCPNVDLFLLDDAFQHRRAGRDFNLVLISAAEPFGLGRVLPRGLLRETIDGLRRADALVITRCSSVPPEKLSKIESFLANQAPSIPIYHADHVIEQMWMSDGNHAVPIKSLASRKMFLATGIGDPGSFMDQIKSAGCDIVPGIFFDDHHLNTEAEVPSIMRDAHEMKCDCIVTTEKDWVKIKRVLPTSADVLPFAVAKLKFEFRGDEGEKLIRHIQL